MSHYLVTGGCGFIGSNLVKALLSREETVFVDIVDNLYSGGANLLPTSGSSDWRFYRENILNFQPSCKYDVIFHQAAISDPRCEDTNRQYDWNVNGFKRVLDIAREMGTR